MYNSDLVKLLLQTFFCCYILNPVDSKPFYTNLFILRYHRLKNEKSNAKHRESEVGWVNLNCEENYFPILDQIIPSMTKQI